MGASVAELSPGRGGGGKVSVEGLCVQACKLDFILNSLNNKADLIRSAL